MLKKTLIVFFIAILTACNSQDRLRENPANDPLSMAVLYNYYATEYKALTTQAYNIAGERIRKIASKTDNVSDLAIVLDIDETVLDNSPYQAAAIIEEFSYPEFWNEWCNTASAMAIPGSLEYLKLADSLGFRIFYISNRKHDYVFEATMDNLLEIGYPQVSPENLLLRLAQSEDNPDPSDKELRRQAVRDRGLEIVMLIGDNLGDFYSDNSTGAEREKSLEEMRKELGRRFIVLPNAMYGNWPAAAGLDGSDEKLEELLKKMSYRK